MSTTHVYVEINHPSGRKIKPKLFNINANGCFSLPVVQSRIKTSSSECNTVAIDFLGLKLFTHFSCFKMRSFVSSCTELLLQI